MSFEEYLELFGEHVLYKYHIAMNKQNVYFYKSITFTISNNTRSTPHSALAWRTGKAVYSEEYQIDLPALK